MSSSARARLRAPPEGVVLVPLVPLVPGVDLTGVVTGVVTGVAPVDLTGVGNVRRAPGARPGRSSRARRPAATSSRRARRAVLSDPPIASASVSALGG